MSKAKLSCRFFNTRDISIGKMLEMHALFSQYYHNADLATFIQDMNAKKGVLILKNKTENRIVGFSTYNEIELEHNGRRAIGVFSGDTIVEEAYWGNKKMHTTFAMKMLATKVKNPSAHVFWLLISKGYKTYLLMTNNFQRFYPCHNKRDVELEDLVDQYCNKLYPSYYNQEKRILDFGEGYHSLKNDAANIDITPGMRASNDNIRFFDNKNPEWRRGTEMPCIGEISFATIWHFFGKMMSGFLPSRKRLKAQKVVA
jgi:hypothetical protein